MGERLLSLYFNDGLRRKPIQGDAVFWQGMWGGLELASVPVSFDPGLGSKAGLGSPERVMTGSPDFNKHANDASKSS